MQIMLRLRPRLLCISVWLLVCWVGTLPVHAAEPAADQELIRELLGEALAAAGSLPPGFGRDDGLRQVVEVQTKLGDLQWARDTADTIQRQDSRTAAFLTVANAQATRGDVPGAVATIARGVPRVATRRDGSPAVDVGKLQALTTLAQLQFKAGNLTAALQLLEVNPDLSGGFKADLRADIAQALAQRGDFAGAFRVADAIRGLFGEAHRAYQGIAVAQAEAGTLDAAVQTAGRIQGAGQYEALGEIAGVLARQQSAAAALHFALVHTPRPRVHPLLALPAPIPGSNPYPYAQAVHYNLLLSQATAQAQAGDVLAALRTVAPLENSAQFEYAYASRLQEGVLAIAKGRIRVGDIPGALDLYGQFGQLKGQDVVLPLIALAQAAQGADAPALHAALAISDTERRERALLDLAARQTQLGRIAAAIATLNAVERLAARTSAMANLVARAQIAQGDLIGALQTIVSLPDIARRQVLLEALARAQARAGDSDSAGRTVGMLPPGRRDPLLGELDVIQLEAGHVSEVSAQARARILWAADPALLRRVGAVAGRTGDPDTRRRVRALPWPRGMVGILLVGIAEGLVERGAKESPRGKPEEARKG